MERERIAPVEVLVTVPFSEGELQALRDVSPRLRINFQAAREPGEISKETWARAEVLYTDQVLPAPELVPALRWLQFHLWGKDRRGRFTLTVDGARQYGNVGLSIGFWH